MSDLTKIQNELKAPKNQFNRFGNFAYRNAEDIQDAIKPLLLKNGCDLHLTDEIVAFGNRLFLKSSAIFKDSTGAETTNSAFAEIALEKKGMDVAQITGSASSYARKYALSAMFLIGGEADPDALTGTAPATPAPSSQIPAAVWRNPSVLKQQPQTVSTNFSNKQ